jgi:hypothetical protein
MAKSAWIGKKLSGRYQIEELLGQGGMSAVYKATDPNLKRVVAVKLIHSHLSNDPDFVKRFEEEAAAVAQLRHPGIIQVYDFNSDDDSYYMILEFVPGETIQDHMKRLNAGGRKLSVTKAVEYIAEICDAVDYAHQRGMIHRDIKPANLMLNVMGQAILMDFGIAKIVGGQRHTATGAVVGTAMYMAPEQIKGERPDRRADIYSLGVTLFEMLSGKPPFEADSAMTLMMMHVNDPVPDLRELNPEVPDDLIAVINKALAKHPDDRYHSAAQMAAALRNVLGRLKTGVSTEAPAPPGATMVETGPGATMIEPPSERETIPPGGTMVEAAEKQPGGTYVEPVSTPEERPAETEGTQVEPILSPQAAAGAAGIASATEGQATGPMPMPSPPGACAEPQDHGLIPAGACGGDHRRDLPARGRYFRDQPDFRRRPGSQPGHGRTAPGRRQYGEPHRDGSSRIDRNAGSADRNPDRNAGPGQPHPDTPYVVITVSAWTNTYVVDYEVHNFPESPQLHVHMFFDTVPPENAGAPGSGPWELTWGPYGDPPFRKYGVANRPGGAIQMCSLVANPNHSVQMGTGNCVDLPE